MLCVVMLFGTTYAWFTDEAKSAGNIIQSGDLEIALEKRTDAGWVDAEGQTINFYRSNGDVATDILWEPGCTYATEFFRVRNTGNLALKFDIALSSVTGDTKLMEALEFNYVEYELDGSTIKSQGTFGTIKGQLCPNGVNDPNLKDATGQIKLSVHMKEDAGNEYENLKLENIGVVVTAQQLPYEYDSLGNQYDAQIESVSSAYFSQGSRTQISVDLANVSGITDVNSFYINILDQNGQLITKITPTQKTIDNEVTDGKIAQITASAVVYGGDSSSWDNTEFVPTMNNVPTTAVLYVNGVQKGSDNISEQFITWQAIVDGYVAP
ncbi:MAG: hypothetical protein IJA01_04670 [Firmicutes bacterium]|nr:hypothetical protein [Bacillota bacterium]